MKKFVLAIACVAGFALLGAGAQDAQAGTPFSLSIGGPRGINVRSGYGGRGRYGSGFRGGYGGGNGYARGNHSGFYQRRAPVPYGVTFGGGYNGRRSNYRPSCDRGFYRY